MKVKGTRNLTFRTGETSGIHFRLCKISNFAFLWLLQLQSLCKDFFRKYYFANYLKITLAEVKFGTLCCEVSIRVRQWSVSIRGVRLFPRLRWMAKTFVIQNWFVQVELYGGANSAINKVTPNTMAFFHIQHSILCILLELFSAFPR